MTTIWLNSTGCLAGSCDREKAKRAEASQRTAEGKPAVYCTEDEDYVLPTITSASSPALLSGKSGVAAKPALVSSERKLAGTGGVTTVHTLAGGPDSKRQRVKGGTAETLIATTVTEDSEEGTGGGEEGQKQAVNPGGDATSSVEAKDTETEDDEILLRFKCGKIIGRGLSAYVRGAVTKRPCSGQNKAGIPCVLKVKNFVEMNSEGMRKSKSACWAPCMPCALGSVQAVFTWGVNAVSLH